MTPPPPESLLSLWRRQVTLHPQALAVRFQDQDITYAELERKSTQLAAWLRRRLSLLQEVPPGLNKKSDFPIVGICLERSLDMVIAVLATLKAGAAYLPLDPRYPRERLAFMAADASIGVLITQSFLLDVVSFDLGQTLQLDKAWPSIQAEPDEPVSLADDADALAYVIYTSGSTGQPKGVAMGRGALANLIAWQCADSRATLGTRTLQYTPLSFDVHLQEFFGTWASGGVLVLVPEEVRLDPVHLLRFLDQEQIERLFLPFIALQSLAEVARTRGHYPTSLREVITAGEQLQITPAVADLFNHLPQCTLANHYGPSETHVVTAYTLPGPVSTWPNLPPIGKPLPGVFVVLFDEKGQPVPDGEPGELLLGGVALAHSYLHRPELTAERFVEREGRRLYRTGDLARRLADGNYEYLGRIDGQVKIRGHRVELGEVELALSGHPSVRQAAVTVHEDVPGQKHLSAYVVLHDAAKLDVTGLRGFLGERLPDYMVPASFQSLERLPTTASGKVDRRALPKPERKRPELAQEYAAPRPGLEETLAQIWRELLGLDRVGSRDNFFELGGNSLLSVQVLTKLRQRTGLDVPVATFFRLPTIALLADHLENCPGQSPSTKPRPARPEAINSGAIAIIGMAGRFPGANNLDELWKNLCVGRESVTLFKDEEIDRSVPEALRKDPAYVKARGILRDADCFDAPFFGITPREAELMDPQHRLFLETAWQALESAGCVPETFPGLIGVYAGTHNNSYYPWAVARRPDLVEKLGDFQTMVANEKDYLATRTAYALNLRGPALSINTACSTSLVAVVQAVHALLAGQCDMALAGGVAVTVPQNSGYLSQEGAMLSPDGHCRPFDAQAQGTIFSNGVGIVVLKRLEDALADSDTIHAVIRGAAVNNDGARKMSFSAPAVDGQAEVIAQAQAMAGVEPETISYVEAHGTATPLGDPVEVQALTQAFRRHTTRKHFCGLGSIKSNFGHLTSAAGVAGLIKTALSLENELLPPTLHFQQPNPRIDWDNSPFRVVSQLTPWPRAATPRRAAVSSFGVGGTNAHVVLEEAPIVEAMFDAPSPPDQLLILSARTETALAAATEHLAASLVGQVCNLPEAPQNDAPSDDPTPGKLQTCPTDLADIAFTLQTGRRAFSQRRFVVASTAAEAVEALRFQSQPVQTHHFDGAAPDVVFMFPGQGTHYARMGKELYEQEPAFRTWFDRCCEIVRPLLKHDLREIVFSDVGQVSNLPAEAERDRASSRGASGKFETCPTTLDQTRFAQPALFILGYSLAKLWQSWGIQPAALLGHSVGEFVAACLAEVFSLEDGLRLIVERAERMQAQPPGGMLSVRLPAEQVSAWLGPECAIASINGPSLCVVSGSFEALDRLEEKCDQAQVVHRRLRTSHAFHSPMMDEVVAPFLEFARTIPLAPPKIPILSTVTAQWLTPEQATAPAYWAGHLRATVRFADAAAAILREPRALLEVGPRSTLATLARQQNARHTKALILASLENTGPEMGERKALLHALGRLWLAGANVDWPALHQGQRRRRVSLPTYPFERLRFWVEPPVTQAREQVPMASPMSPSPPPSDHLQPCSTLLGGGEASGVRGKDFASSSPEAHAMSPSRKHRLVDSLRELFEESSGIDLHQAAPEQTFLELGLDSLFLTQAALTLQRKFKVPVTFRQLLEELPSLERLAGYLDQKMPPDPEPTSIPQTGSAPAMLPGDRQNGAGSSEGLPHLIAQQLQLIARQLELLNGGAILAVPSPAPHRNGAHSPSVSKAETLTNGAAAKPFGAAAKPFGAAARISLKQEGLSPRQKDGLADITRRYNERTRRSKEMTHASRGVLADPRVVSGFRPETKEIVYPIVVNRSAGCKLWDADGNEYIDLTCGFGSNFFGYSPPFIVDALSRQLQQGYEIGPQNPLAGAVAAGISRLTGMDRVVFCNTGSEAVLGAVRLARTAAGRNTVVLFNGAYHGINDEVIVRPGKAGRSVPAAAGIPPGAVENVLILDYGDPEALKIIEARGDDLAAVLVEPVQSRHPDLQPRDFLHQLRRLTEKSGAALIFDEVITGFRLHPGGAQAWFDVRADLATYGKVIGGGLPIGVIAGCPRFMNALDGGAWEFGDASFPETGVTYFAGTFVRHPLALAAADAVVHHLEAEGQALYDRLNAKSDRLCAALNTWFAEVEAPLRLEHCGSLFKVAYTQDVPLPELLYTLLRLRGIHIWDARPCFLTTSHEDDDLARIIQAFKEAVLELQDAGFYPPPASPSVTSEQAQAPLPGARLGKDPRGQPAWYVPDPQRPGKFLKVGDAT